MIFRVGLLHCVHPAQLDLVGLEPNLGKVGLLHCVMLLYCVHPAQRDGRGQRRLAGGGGRWDYAGKVEDSATVARSPFHLC
jgi:hypothetical protein